MSRIHDRDQLVAQLTRELPEVSLYEVVQLARKLLRAGTTLQRLAEAQCNGDWPADNGQRTVKECGACGQAWVPSTLRKQLPFAEDHTVAIAQDVCQDCCVQDRVKKLLKPYGLVPRFDGDPRGPVLRVFRREVDWQRVENGSERGIYVS